MNELKRLLKIHKEDLSQVNIPFIILDDIKNFIYFLEHGDFPNIAFNIKELSTEQLVLLHNIGNNNFKNYFTGLASDITIEIANRIVNEYEKNNPAFLKDKLHELENIIEEIFNTECNNTLPLLENTLDLFEEIRHLIYKLERIFIFADIFNFKNSINFLKIKEALEEKLQNNKKESKQIKNAYFSLAQYNGYKENWELTKILKSI